jgi:hypothetical protein
MSYFSGDALGARLVCDAVARWRGAMPVPCGAVFRLDHAAASANELALAAFRNGWVIEREEQRCPEHRSRAVLTHLHAQRSGFRPPTLA